MTKRNDRAVSVNFDQDLASKFEEASKKKAKIADFINSIRD